MNDLVLFPKIYISTEESQQNVWHAPRTRRETLTPLLITMPFAKNVVPNKTIFFAKLLSVRTCKAFGPCVSNA